MESKPAKYTIEKKFSLDQMTASKYNTLFWLSKFQQMLQYQSYETDLSSDGLL